MLYVKIVLRGERYAIFARKTVQDSWVEVEDILGEDEAKRFAEDLENDDEKRIEYIVDNSTVGDAD